jgi:hypothetical protein
MRIVILTSMFLIGSAVLIPNVQQARASDRMKVQYIGGTIADLSAKAEGNIRTTDADVFEFQCVKSDIRINYAKINLVEYGQKVDRRYAMAFLLSPMFLLSKSRQHFLTIGYTDQSDKQQAMIFRVGKGNVRQILVSLEARTGLKVQYQDGEARKAGKG